MAKKTQPEGNRKEIMTVFDDRPDVFNEPVPERATSEREERRISDFPREEKASGWGEIKDILCEAKDAEGVWADILAGIDEGKDPLDIIGDIGKQSESAADKKSKTGKAGTAKNTGTSKKGVPEINTYPEGVPSGLYPNLFVTCKGDDITLEDALKYIKEDWCEKWDEKIKVDKKMGLGLSKHVLLITDKWDENVFDNYREDFRRRAMHEDFWFFIVMKTKQGYMEIPFLKAGLYKFTRHCA